MTTENNSSKRKLLITLAVAVLIVVGVVVGVLLMRGDEPQQRVVEVVEESVEVVEDGPRFDYGPWNDLNYYFDCNNVGMLARDRFTVRTSELCVNVKNWRSPLLASGEREAYVFATPELCIRTEHPSNPKSYIINGLCYGVKVRVLEECADNIAKVEYVSGETKHPVEGSLVGYVSREYLTSERVYNLMNRYVLPNEAAEARFKVSKWRLAAADIISAVGATPDGPNITIDVEKVVVVERDKESVVVFGLEREDSDVKLLAIVEFFAADNEYRILGIIPGEMVEDVQFYNTGDYVVRYTTSKSDKR
jgi:hypothetical protein